MEGSQLVIFKKNHLHFQPSTKKLFKDKALYITKNFSWPFPVFLVLYSALTLHNFFCTGLNMRVNYKNIPILISPLSPRIIRQITFTKKKLGVWILWKAMFLWRIYIGISILVIPDPMYGSLNSWMIYLLFFRVGDHIIFFK